MERVFYILTSTYLCHYILVYHVVMHSYVAMHMICKRDQARSSVATLYQMNIVEPSTYIASALTPFFPNTLFFS